MHVLDEFDRWLEGRREALRRKRGKCQPNVCYSWHALPEMMEPQE